MHVLTRMVAGTFVRRLGSRDVGPALRRRRGDGLAPLRVVVLALVMAAAAGYAGRARGEDGYRLWLRYVPVAASRAVAYRSHVTDLIAGSATPTQKATLGELQRGLAGLLGGGPPLATAVTRDGALIVGTPAASPLIAGMRLDTRDLGDEGYLIRSVVVDGHAATVIVGNTDVGALYGAFRFLRLLQTGQSLARLDLRSRPRVKLRVLDHWDNLNGTVDRGYAGASIWKWRTLPEYLSPRYTDYARADASIGINGVVLNNVNADPRILTPAYLEKVAALAQVFRPYGIHVYLSVPFNAPMVLGGLRTADPVDPQVQAWWHTKADDIYRIIPDFGGFLVKADSEGQPGPRQYGRSEAQGANMLAAALATHGGVVMWRAFIYSNQPHTDRIKQGYDEFQPLDGRFAANVLVQIKNGALDFQPREPFNSVFGRMPGTNLAIEFPVTKEYMGNNTQLVYLGPYYQETLSADTYVHGPGSTVAKVVEGALSNRELTGMAGVANVGSDRDWCGSVFDQANWYAYGRFAWNPEASARGVAEDWVRMTFGNDDHVVRSVVRMMMGSREAMVDYMTPLGLASQMQPGSHQGPAPWDAGEPANVTSVYFSQASHGGIGFDRTANGSDAVAQYAPHVAHEFASLQQVPDRFLLWFHHVPWTYRMRSGATLWDALVQRYTAGVDYVAQMRRTWAALDGSVDRERHQRVAAFLAIQQRAAQRWRDASIAYFQSLNGLPLPAGYAPPAHPLDYYESHPVEFPKGVSSW